MVPGLDTGLAFTSLKVHSQATVIKYVSCEWRLATLRDSQLVTRKSQLTAIYELSSIRGLPSSARYR